jgi:gas vesicle protein
MIVLAKNSKEIFNMADNGGDKFLYFLAGTGIGAALALLFAPKSGRETREMLAKTATDSRDFLTNKVSEGRTFVDETRRKVTDDLNTFVDRGKEAVQRQKDQLSAALEAGKTAYHEEKGSPAE